MTKEYGKNTFICLRYKAPIDLRLTNVLFCVFKLYIDKQKSFSKCSYAVSPAAAQVARYSR